MTAASVNVILASQSPRRVELMRSLGASFDVMIPAGVEELTAGDRPHVLAMQNAQRKATAVARQHPRAVVIGADTIVVLDGRIFGKPRDETEATSMVMQLQGRQHDVITGVCVVHRDLETEITFYETTRVWMRRLTREEAAAYVATHQPIDKAGAYGIQDSANLIDRIEGSHSNVVGLPLERLRGTLEKLGVLADA